MLHDCIFKQCSAAAGGRWGAAPDPAGEDDPPWGPAGCGRCKTYFSSNLPQRQRERWGAAPDPAGEDVPPRTPPLADGIRLIFLAVYRRSKENENTPLPGRPAKPARLCASAQGKGWRFPEKQARLFSRKSPAFSVARELSCRHRKFQARIVCFIRRATSPRWVQGPMVPGSGVRGLKKPPRPCCPGVYLAT